MGATPFDLAEVDTTSLEKLELRRGRTRYKSEPLGVCERAAMLWSLFLPRNGNGNGRREARCRGWAHAIFELNQDFHRPVIPWSVGSE